MVKCKCGSENISQTLRGIVEGPDINTYCCLDCGARGRMWELTENEDGR